MNPVEDYFLRQEEPYQSIMLYIRSVVLKTLPDITERYSYGIPFYNVGKKPLLYLNILKGTDFVDVAFVQGVLLQDDFPMLKDNNKRKQVRSIQVRSLEEFDQLGFEELLLVAENKIRNSKKAWFI